MAEKQKTIVVNGEQKVVTADELSFDQIVDLAFDPSQRGPQIEFTVDYRKGDDKKPKGSLVQGQTVKIKDGMIFDVTRTDKS
jgi:hypothetical protein